MKKILFLFTFIWIISSVYSVTTINSLPYNITTPGAYDLSGNLASTGYGIIISTQNVTVDCLGYTITGDLGVSDYGIYIASETSDLNNISNCNLLNYAGIYNNAGDNNSFQNISITNISGNSNIYLNTNSDYNIFNNITINTSSTKYTLYSSYSQYNIINNSNLGDGYGYFGASDNSKIQNSYFTHNNSYISIARPSDVNDCLIDLINVTKPGGKYIYNFHSTINIDGWTNISQLTLCNADNSTIQNLNLIGNRSYSGITAIELNNVTFLNLNISNYTVGISGSYSSNNNLTNINTYSNSQDGILFATSSNNNNFNNINSYNNTVRGIYFATSSNNTLININFSLNTQYGIESSASSDINLLNSTIYDNGYIDIYIYGTTNTHCNNILSNVTDNYGKYHYYFNQSVNIDGWTNISSISLCNADNSTIKNLNYNGLNDKGTFIFTARTDYSNFSNLNISHYYYGIYLNTNSNYNNLNNFTTFNSTYGLSLSTSSNNIIANFTSYNNTLRGFHIAFGGNNNITNFTTYNNQIGLSFGSSTFNIISNFSTYKNTQQGIDIQSNDNYFENFNSYNNTLNGISNSGQRNKFNNFNTYYNSQQGISLTGSSNNNLSNFRSYNNLQRGIYIISISNYNNLSNFSTYNNANDGMFIFSSCNYNSFNNFNIYNNSNYGINDQSDSNNNYSNFNIYNNSNFGIYLSNSRNSIFSNFSIINQSSYGVTLQYLTINNTFLNGTILNNTNYNLNFDENGANKPVNNTFYNNHLGNKSKLYSDNWTNINYFNYTLAGVGNIGNYWTDFPTCSAILTLGTYKVCTNPGNYTINSTNNIYDFAPLIVAPEYISPTPINMSTYGGKNFTIRIEDTQGVSNSFIVTINGVSYSMINISSTKWEYTISAPYNVITNVTFNVSYGGSSTMETRVFTYYPNHSNEILPFYTLFSGLLTLILIFIGGFFWTQNKKTREGNSK